MTKMQKSFLSASAILILTAAYTYGTAARVDPQGDKVAKMVEKTNASR